MRVHCAAATSPTHGYRRIAPGTMGQRASKVRLQRGRDDGCHYRRLLLGVLVRVFTRTRCTACTHANQLSRTGATPRPTPSLCVRHFHNIVLRLLAPIVKRARCLGRCCAAVAAAVAVAPVQHDHILGGGAGLGTRRDPLLARTWTPGGCTTYTSMH